MTLGASAPGRRRGNDKNTKHSGINIYENGAPIIHHIVYAPDVLESQKLDPLQKAEFEKSLAERLRAYLKGPKTAQAWLMQGIKGE